MTASSAKPGGARAGVGLGQVVDAGEQLGQVEEHRDEAAEGQEVEERRAPTRAPLGAGTRTSAANIRAPGRARRRARRARARPRRRSIDRDQRRRRPRTARPAPTASAIRGAVRPASTVPPMPIAVDAEREALALGRVPAVDERHADRERGAGEAEQEPEARGSPPNESCDERERDQRQRREAPSARVNTRRPP